MTAIELRNENMRRFGFGCETMKNIRICKKCGKPATGKLLHCKQCSALLSTETLFDFYKKQHAVCRGCDTVLPDGSHFCPKCGAVNESPKERFKEGEEI